MACGEGRQLAPRVVIPACPVSLFDRRDRRVRKKQLLKAFLLHRISRGKRKQNQTLDVVP